MATFRKSLDVRQDRFVITYEPHKWPEAVITGFRGEDKGFKMEHIIVLPGAPQGALVGAMKAAIAEAWDWGFEYIEFWIPGDHPLFLKLDRLARWQGFTLYHQNEHDVKFYVLWRRPGEPATV